jgi:transposase
MHSLPESGPPRNRYRIFYTLANGQQRFSQAFSDHEFADRWCEFIRLARGVTHADVVTLVPPPSVCAWSGQALMPLDEANAVCIDCDRFVLAVACGRLENQLSDLVFPPKMNAANERLAQHLWAHRDDLFTFRRQPGLDATNWRAELAVRFGVILRKVWGGSRTWVGARAQAVLMSVWRTCWQHGRSAVDFLSQLLRGSSALALPP